MPLPSLRRLICTTALLLNLPALGQVLAIGEFTASKPDPGWSFTGTPALTAPGVDREGDGWLRLTGSVHQSVGRAFYTRNAFSAARGLTVAFSYASWGGGDPGADGIVLILFDATGNMSGAAQGSGLGFCKGAGAWLGLALDEYGNFSHPQEGCAGGGGPGRQPQALALRGPTAASNPFVAAAPVPGNVDQPLAQKRPGAAEVIMTLAPKTSGLGFTVNVDWRGAPGGAWARLINQADFPYAAPAVISMGLSATTGGARNIHEVRRVRVVANHSPPTVSQTFEPAIVAPGGTSTLVLRLAGATGTSSSLAQTFTHQLPAALKIADAPRLGGTCPGTVQAKAGSSAIVVERGSGLRAAGCIISVDVTSAAVGAWDSVVPVGSIVTDQGTNITTSAATLTVRVGAR